MTDRKEATILGRSVGTLDGWDWIDDNSFVLYNFEPAEGFDMPKYDLTVDFSAGKFSNFSYDDGSLILEKDFLTVMNGFVARQQRL